MTIVVSMCEYVSREAVYQAIMGEHPDAHYPDWYASLIEKIPVADVRPVVRGHWEERIVDGERIFYNRRFYCSACGGWNTYGKTEYCPRCGAEMRGRNE